MGIPIRTPRYKHYAVYWPPTGETDPSGQVIYGELEERSPDTDPPNGVRWDDIQEVAVDAMGAEIVSAAKVYVREPVEVDGVLWRGKISDLEDWDRPLNNKGAFIIRKYNEIDNLRATKTLRIAIL